MTTPYKKGYEKERLIVQAARASGKLAFRSAGSHSPIDVCIIDTVDMTVRFIQAKSKNFPDSSKKKLEEQYSILNDYYKCTFEVV